MRYYVIGLFAFLIGCSQAVWTHPTNSPTALERDNGLCESRGYSLGTVWSSGDGTYIPLMNRAAYSSCMVGLGYQHGSTNG